MEYLGQHNERKVYWWEYLADNFNELPDNDWICLAIEDRLPEGELFGKFVRFAVAKGILEFKTFGKESIHLDDEFDHIHVAMKVIEGSPDRLVMTTWHDDESLANTFWQCFHATALPNGTINENVKIVCFHFDNKNKKEELANYLKRFNDGWLPPDEE
jgi:hypothetical protein